MSKTFHISLSVRGALRAPRHHFKNAFQRKDGTFLSYEEVREELMDHLSQGHEVIPGGDCDNFDWKSGGLGHENAN